ncbi:hypothetical protein JCM11641_005609 [Rhodosporidiobolus odoratus]
MNSLYTLALRQSTSLNSDLDSYSSLPPTSTQLSALSGQLTAGIAAFSRTLDDYDSFARREIVDVKKEKALQRVARFREEERAHRDRWDRCRKDMQQKVTSLPSLETARGPGACRASSPALAGDERGARSASDLWPDERRTLRQRWTTRLFKIRTAPSLRFFLCINT